MANTSEDHVLVAVCEECGREYFFQEAVPEDLACERCGNQVFRTFEADTVPDEVEDEFREETERDLAPDDPEGDVVDGDIRDLKNI
ncbi:MAG: hypothetical protein P8Z36_17770 [Gemmatimonadota bacterium]